ncbi:Thioredoxin [Melia azedarach]|uniref:Thioredoxin n=1 Tax=Melia azedarach TaxID=155640 RepID=A0ACC1XIW4_MELAZ|nr:Thioredoxin [Melia azedarach]
MGANVSGLENPAHGYIHTKTSQLTELYSKHQWRTQLEACKQSDKLTVIYFTAAWCGPCKFVEPYVKELASCYADVDFFKEAVRAFDEPVDVMPTFIMAKRGKEIDRVVGAKKEELKTKTEKHRL